jgi:hypothetical protein
MEVQSIPSTTIILSAKPAVEMNQLIELEQIKRILYLGVKSSVKTLDGQDHSVDTFA